MYAELWQKEERRVHALLKRDFCARTDTRAVAGEAAMLPLPAKPCD
ncbi:MAG: hypothetical protein H7Y38_17695 [Armatimonadetes bacterium]|nr:hypothetical protein [Armatimonadota bacterium]